MILAYILVATGIVLIACQWLSCLANLNTTEVAGQSGQPEQSVSFIPLLGGLVLGSGVLWMTGSVWWAIAASIADPSVVLWSIHGTGFIAERLSQSGSRITRHCRRSARSRTTATPKEDMLNQEFGLRGYRGGNTFIYPPDVALDYLQRCREIELRVIGLAAFHMYGNSVRPDMSEDFWFDLPREHKELAWDWAEQRLREKLDTDLHYEFITVE